MPRPDMTDESLLERWGKSYFRSLSREARIVDVDGVHFLNERERAGLARVQRAAILRAALTVVAGLDLVANEEAAVAAAMARAALELPNPTGAIFGVNPRRDASRLRLIVASLIYKLKVSLSSFLTKMFVRRMLGRALVRAWLPFVAVPITAAWNAFVCFLVMREARIRAMGPSAAKELTGQVFAGAPPLSPEGRRVVVRAVASSIVRTEDMHPNLVAVLHEVIHRVGEERVEAIDDTRLFLERLGRLSRDEQDVALKILVIAAVIDGRVTRAERRLLRDARRACGLSEDVARDEAPDEASVERLQRAFVSGDALPSRIFLREGAAS